MGFEPLEDALPLPQIVRTMKSITVPSYGRSFSVFDNGASSDVDGGGEPGGETRRQETRSRSPEECPEICSGSGNNRVWDEVEYLLSSLERTKEMLSDGTDWDPDEVKWIQERYRLCKRQALDFVLRMNLSEILTTLSFPGERLSYLEIATRAVTDCTSWELEQAIREIGLNPYERIYFKADASRPSVEGLERILLTMHGDANYVLAGEFNRKLNLDLHSASYKAVKRDLEESGWRWKTKRINGKVVKVIQK
jgi:hypothetical protein